MAEMRVDGDDTLVKKLDSLSRKDSFKISKKSLGKGVSFYLKNVKKEAPKVTGALRRSFGRKAFNLAHQGKAIVYTGVRSAYVDKKTGKKPMFYAHAVNKKHRFVQKAIRKSERGIGNAVTNEAEKLFSSTL